MNVAYFYAPKDKTKFRKISLHFMENAVRFYSRTKKASWTWKIREKQKLKKEQIQGEKEANITHYKVGAKIRKTIQELGGTMPEDITTPEKSLKQLEKEKQNKLKK